jgi:hypothetical protein
MQNGPSILRSGSEAVSELYEPISKSNIKSFLRPPSGPPPPSPYPESGSRLPLGLLFAVCEKLGGHHGDRPEGRGYKPDKLATLATNQPGNRQTFQLVFGAEYLGLVFRLTSAVLSL